VRGLWNFTEKELPQETDPVHPVIVENVHLGDSLMTLSYRLCADKSDSDSLSDSV
jgi:NADH/NAD ratio-sensing transcriptional regulator Rex